MVRAERSQKEFAEAFGVHEKTLAKYERGVTSPDSALLQAICDKHPEINPGWLLTGAGPMHHGAAGNRPVSDFDEQLMEQIAHEIAEVYRQENGRLNGVQLVRATAHMYADLVDLYETTEERIIGLKALLQQLRRELRTPSADGGSGKRLA